MKPQELIEITLDTILAEDTYASIHLSSDPPEEETEWARQLIISRIEELDLVPTEEELYALMKLRMKV